MGKFNDLTGQKFGEVLVLGKDEELSSIKNRLYWKCQCSCGRIKSIRSDNLKKIQTCGECSKDLTNKKFGKLIPIEKGKKDKAQHQYWICKCDCGNIVEVNSDNLRRGLTQSCGCLHTQIMHELHFKDVTGQRFGKLIALSYKIQNQKSYWTCQCDCGNICEVPLSNLTNGHTQSCGCINYSIGESNIVKVLNNNNIAFIKEYTFLDLPKLRFDFYLPELNRLIEFDGKQYYCYETTWYKTEDEFLEAQKRDKIKNNYAISNNILLVRIPYYERDNIDLNLILGDKYLINNENEVENG